MPEDTLLEEMKFVTLTPLMKLAVPALYISSLPKNAIGFSFERGRFGTFVGSLLLVATVAVGLILSRLWGLVAFPLTLWLMGSTSLVMLYGSAANKIAFVKPLCSSCRLAPIIAEHEAIHLTGIATEEGVWSEMKKRYSCESLSLDEDPAICSFCPIPKRLREH